MINDARSRSQQANKIHATSFAHATGVPALVAISVWYLGDYHVCCERQINHGWSSACDEVFALHSIVSAGRRREGSAS